MQHIKLNNQIFSTSDQKKGKRKKTLFRAAGRRKKKHPHMFVLETKTFTENCAIKWPSVGQEKNYSGHMAYIIFFLGIKLFWFSK